MPSPTTLLDLLEPHGEQHLLVLLGPPLRGTTQPPAIPTHGN